MRTLVLLWVLGFVSAVDEQSERPAYIISQDGSPPGYSNGQPFFGAPVSSNNVKVLPNAYKTPQGFEKSGGGPISVPVIVDRNTPFQGITNQPIPVPVAYPDDVSVLNGQSQPASGTNSLPIQRPPYPGVTPIPVLVKAPAFSFRGATSAPRPFQARNPQFSHETSSENPFFGVSPAFRLWPKLPEPIPVPVLTADAFLRNSYRNLNMNLAPQYPQHVKNSDFSLNNQNPFSIRFSDDSQFQTQPIQSANQGPIYIIVPGLNNNGKSGSYQAPLQTQASYQSQTPQSGNQRFIILAPSGANSQSNQAYQNDGYSSNQYFGSQLQDQSSQQPSLNYVFGSSNAPGSQSQAQSGQQAPLNYAVFAPPNAPSSQSQAPTDQQSSLKYAIFGTTNAPESVGNPAGQAPQNYVAFAPGSQSSNIAGQSPLTIAFGSNGGSSYSSSTSSPSQYFGYSSTPSPSPQYVGYSSTPSPSPQYVGYSSTPSPSPQYVDYSSTLSSPQYSGYSSSTTPSPSQTSNSQSTPISRVSFSGAGSSYSYSIK